MFLEFVSDGRVGWEAVKREGPVLASHGHLGQIYALERMA